jgi:hypothetical protein
MALVAVCLPIPESLELLSVRGVPGFLQDVFVVEIHVDRCVGN